MHCAIHEVIMLRRVLYRSGIQKYAFEPPRALTSSLGREVEKFDQLCDAVEAQLVRLLNCCRCYC